MRGSGCALDEYLCWVSCWELLFIMRCGLRGRNGCEVGGPYWWFGSAFYKGQGLRAKGVGRAQEQAGVEAC